MSMENNIIRFTGKNFPTWAFQFKMFLKGKELSNHIDNSTPIPIGVLLQLKLCGSIYTAFIIKIIVLENYSWSWRLVVTVKVT